MREEFEKLPEIAQLIEEGKGDNLAFITETNRYDAEMYITFTPDYVHYLNGAWYAYQEQQKKINTAIEYLDSIEGLVWYEQIKDILK